MVAGFDVFKAVMMCVEMLLVLVLVLFFVFLGLYLTADKRKENKEKKMSEDSFVVSMPIDESVGCVFCFVFFVSGIIFLVSKVSDGSGPSNIYGLIPCLGGLPFLYLMIYCFTFKVKCVGDVIYVKSFFKKERKVLFSEITNVETRGVYYTKTYVGAKKTIHSGTKKIVFKKDIKLFTFSDHMVGSGFLIKRLEREKLL